MKWNKEGLKRTIRRITNTQSLIEKASLFVACEKIEGDYLEFGTYRGLSFISAYRALEHAFQRRTKFTTGVDEENEDNAERRRIWSAMRFIGFDSFQGLPALTKDDQGTGDFKEGMYSCSETEFLQNIAENNIPTGKVIAINGYYEDTCTRETAKQYDIRKAAIVYIDCDLYSSAHTALQFISHFLQDGTVIIFDDWYSYKGSPYRGEQKAFYEWSASPNIRKHFQLSEYQKEDWKKNSFIVSTKTRSHHGRGRA